MTNSFVLPNTVNLEFSIIEITVPERKIVKKSKKKIRARYKATSNRKQNLELNSIKQSMQDEITCNQSSYEANDQQDQANMTLIQDMKQEPTQQIDSQMKEALNQEGKQPNDMSNKINKTPNQNADWSLDLPFDVFKASSQQDNAKVDEAEIAASDVMKLDESNASENLRIKEHAPINPHELLAEALIRPHGLQSNDSNVEVNMGTTYSAAPANDTQNEELERPVLKRSKPKTQENEEIQAQEEDQKEILMPVQQNNAAERDTTMTNKSDINIWKNLLSDLQKNTEQNEVVMEEIEEEIDLQHQRHKQEVLEMYEKVVEQMHALEKLLDDLKTDTSFSLPEDVKTKESFIQSVEERLDNSKKLAKTAEDLLNTQTTTPEKIETIRIGRRDDRTQVRARFPREAILGNWIHYFTKDMFTCQCFWDDGDFKEYDFRNDRLVEERTGTFRVQNNQVLLNYDEGRQAVYTVCGYSDECLDYLINKTSVRFDYIAEEDLNRLLEGSYRR